MEKDRLAISHITKMGKKSKNKTKPANQNGQVKKQDKTDSLKSKNLDDFLQDWSDEGSDADKASEKESHVDDERKNGDAKVGATQQKKYLANLKDKDPEFYKFLEENDKELLNFDESSDEEGGSDQEGDGPELDDVHKLNGEEEDDSDSEEDESEDDDVSEAPKKSNKLSSGTVDEWSTKLEKNPNVKIVSEVVMALRAALENISVKKEETSKPTKDGKSKKPASTKPKVKVENGQVFNALIKLCITKLEPALATLLKAKKKLNDNKNWRPLNKWLKAYTMDLVKLVMSISEASMVSALLKHIHSMVPYYSYLPKSSKSLMKTLISLWSTHSEESVRVLAFMALLRLTRSVMKGDLSSLVEMAMKQMYMAYIRNAKFTSPNTWPMIHFMRRSLAEIFLLDPELAYRHAFIYIRQLTIHLRNAMMNVTQKKKESPIQTVIISKHLSIILVR